mmetsp:Transcript_35699/g.37092  ORF Transcript_35699/g.37092 Transcript_35699/m.37092 type:complete len:245 (+) Transcript_35699:3-737(+)
MEEQPYHTLMNLNNPDLKSNDTLQSLDSLDRSKFLIVGIAGISRSGKSSSRKYLEKSLTINPRNLFNLDNFFVHPEKKFDDTIQDYIENWDTPDILLFKELHQAIAQRMLDIEKEGSVFNRINNDEGDKGDKDDTENKANHCVLKKEIIVVEGYILFHSQLIWDFLDVKIMIDLSYEEAKKRRLNNKNFHGEHGEYYFDNYIWKGFHQYNECFDNNQGGSYVIKGNQSLDSLCQEVEDIVTKHL